MTGEKSQSLKKIPHMGGLIFFKFTNKYVMMYLGKCGIIQKIHDTHTKRINKQFYHRLW